MATLIFCRIDMLFLTPQSAYESRTADRKVEAGLQEAACPSPAAVAGRPTSLYRGAGATQIPGVGSTPGKIHTVVNRSHPVDIRSVGPARASPEPTDQS